MDLKVPATWPPLQHFSMQSVCAFFAPSYEFDILKKCSLSWGGKVSVLFPAPSTPRVKGPRTPVIKGWHPYTETMKERSQFMLTQNCTEQLPVLNYVISQIVRSVLYYLKEKRKDNYNVISSSIFYSNNCVMPHFLT